VVGIALQKEILTEEEEPNDRKEVDKNKRQYPGQQQ